MTWLAATAALLLLAGAGAGAQAGGVQPLDALREAAAQAVRQAAPADARLVVEADRLDPRLRLPACPGALHAEAPDLRRRIARVSVPVSCTAGADWSVRVPVSVQMFRKVLVSSHGLARGDVMGPGDVRVEERDVARLGYGYLVEPAQLYGRKLRRAVAVDQAITLSMLAPREVVRRGQQVQVVARLHGIRVRAEGVALEAGDRGEPVRVRSLSCDCVVQGRVSSPGIVEALP